MSYQVTERCACGAEVKVEGRFSCLVDNMIHNWRITHPCPYGQRHQMDGTTREGEPVTEIRLDAFRFRRNASRPDRWESVDETLDNWASEHAAALNAALDEIERLRNALYWAALDYDDPADQVDYWIRKGNR